MCSNKPNLVLPVVSLTWPVDFPDGCPPEQSAPSGGVYFRIVKTDPPGLSDFVSAYHQKRPAANLEINRGSRTLCETMGLSVYADPTDAILCAGQFPKLGTLIARVNLTPQSGKLLGTGRPSNSHHTWWMVHGFNPIGCSEVVDSL